jgi:hypothetical protein
LWCGFEERLQENDRVAFIPGSVVQASGYNTKVSIQNYLSIVYDLRFTL